MTTKNTGMWVIELFCWAFFTICGCIIARWLIIRLLAQVGLHEPEWPGWVQAFGSIAALAVAIYVMNRQHELTQSAQLLASQSKYRLAVTATNYALQRLDKALDILIGDIKNNQTAANLLVEIHLAAFQSISNSLARLPFYEISGVLAEYILKIHHDCDEVIAVLVGLKGRPPKNMQMLADFFQDHRSRIPKYREVIEGV